MHIENFHVAVKLNHRFFQHGIPGSGGKGPCLLTEIITSGCLYRMLADESLTLCFSMFIMPTISDSLGICFCTEESIFNLETCNQCTVSRNKIPARIFKVCCSSLYVFRNHQNWKAAMNNMLMSISPADMRTRFNIPAKIDETPSGRHIH